MARSATSGPGSAGSTYGGPGPVGPHRGAFGSGRVGPAPSAAILRRRRAARRAPAGARWSAPRTPPGGVAPRPRPDGPRTGRRAGRCGRGRDPARPAWAAAWGPRRTGRSARRRAGRLAGRRRRPVIVLGHESILSGGRAGGQPGPTHTQSAQSIRSASASWLRVLDQEARLADELAGPLGLDAPRAVAPLVGLRLLLVVFLLVVVGLGGDAVLEDGVEVGLDVVGVDVVVVLLLLLVVGGGASWWRSPSPWVRARPRQPRPRPLRRAPRNPRRPRRRPRRRQGPRRGLRARPRSLPRRRRRRRRVLRLASLRQPSGPFTMRPSAAGS